jgi:hypothetical protein
MVQPEAELLRRPLAPFLDVCVVLDLPGVRRFVNRGHARAWGVPDGELYARALHNLPVGDGLRRWSRADRVWAWESQDGTAAARLAHPGFLRSLADHVRGRVVAFVPDIDHLWVCGEDEGLPLDRAADEAAERFAAAPIPVSPAGYTVRGNQVVPWIPPADHPLYLAAATQHRLLAGHEYRRQHGPLQAWMNERNSPDYLAPFSLMRYQTGRTVSFACWPDGPTLLPFVEYVVLGNPQEVHHAPWLPWHTLLGSGAAVPEPDLAPVRYRVGRYPSGLRERAGPVPQD